MTKVSFVVCKLHHVSIYPMQIVHYTASSSCATQQLPPPLRSVKRRELALGLRSAEASLAATRGRSRRRRGGAGARETQRRRLPSRSALGALDLLSRLGPRAVTASMLRRSLPFQPTLAARWCCAQRGRARLRRGERCFPRCVKMFLSVWT